MRSQGRGQGIHGTAGQADSIGRAGRQGAKRLGAKIDSLVGCMSHGWMLYERAAGTGQGEGSEGGCPIAAEKKPHRQGVASIFPSPSEGAGGDYSFLVRSALRRPWWPPATTGLWSSGRPAAAARDGPRKRVYRQHES